MKRHPFALSAAVVVLSAASLAACEKKENTAGPGPAETVGKQLDQAAARAGEELNKAAAKAGETMQQAGQKIQEKAAEAQKENKNQ